jgi:hypothetical protein
MNAPEMNDSAPKKKQPFKNDADKILLLTRALCDVKRQNNPILASKSRKKELLFDFHAFVRVKLTVIKMPRFLLIEALQNRSRGLQNHK